MISVFPKSLNILNKKFDTNRGIFQQREKVIVFDDFDPHFKTRRVKRSLKVNQLWDDNSDEEEAARIRRQRMQKPRKVKPKKKDIKESEPPAKWREVNIGDELEAWEIGIILEDDCQYNERVFIVDQEFPSLGPNTMKKRFKPKPKPLLASVNPMFQTQSRFYNSKKVIGESFKHIADGSEPNMQNMELSKNPNLEGAAKPNAAPISDAEIAAFYATPEKKFQESKIKFESGGPKKFINAKKEAQKQNDSPQKPDE